MESNPLSAQMILIEITRGSVTPVED